MPRILRYALFYAACALILAACALAWIAMLAPYRMPPEKSQGVNHPAERRHAHTDALSAAQMAAQFFERDVGLGGDG